MNKKNMLMISYAYPPIKAMGSLRPYYLAKNLDKARWDIYVFSTSNYKILETDSNFQSLSCNIKIENLPTFDLRTIKFLIGKILRKKDIPVTEGMLKTARSFPFNIFADGGLTFILNGFFRGLSYVKRYNIDYIFSTYSPYCNHIIGSLLKAFKKDLVWIADFRDLPFGDKGEDIFLPGMQERFNRSIFKNADYIITVSNGLKEKLKKYNQNIEVIRNGIPLDVETAGMVDIKTDTFNIVYTGSLYYKKSDAALLFGTLRRLLDRGEIGKDFKLIYAGKQSGLWKNWAKINNLNDNVGILGYLDRKRTLELQRSASINLVLSWSNENDKGIITGKFYEYLAASKPILCIVNGEKDEEIEDLYRELNSGLVVYDDANLSVELESFIKDLYREWKKKGFVAWRYADGNLGEFRYKNISKQFEEILLRKENSPDVR